MSHSEQLTIDTIRKAVRNWRRKLITDRELIEKFVQTLMSVSLIRIIPECISVMPLKLRSNLSKLIYELRDYDSKQRETYLRIFSSRENTASERLQQLIELIPRAIQGDDLSELPEPYVLFENERFWMYLQSSPVVDAKPCRAPNCRQPKITNSLFVRGIIMNGYKENRLRKMKFRHQVGRICINITTLLF